METNAVTIHYEYDELNQLVTEYLSDWTEIDYVYDVVGNRTQKKVTAPDSTVTTTTYTYDNANELTYVGAQAYTYDVNGNLTNNGDNYFVYDEINQLSEVKDSSGNPIATFTYDNKGRRISSTVAETATYFH